VTAQARRYLTELERERDALRSTASPQGELPLFVAPREPLSRDPAPPLQPPGDSPHAATTVPESPALAALRAIDPDSVTPRQALDLLFKLKQLDRGQ
jgi:DNA mismatch repair protein MutS